MNVIVMGRIYGDERYINRGPAGAFYIGLGGPGMLIRMRGCGRPVDDDGVHTIYQEHGVAYLASWWGFFLGGSILDGLLSGGLVV